MKKLLLILVLFMGSFTYGQVFTQTFVDRCTGETKIVTANFTQGSAVVSFYSRVRTFTYQEFLQGQLQSWLAETYNWWNTLSPCSDATQQAQQAQQTANQAQQAAQQAQTAANNASQAATTASTAATAATSAATSVPTVPPTTTPPPTTSTTAPTTTTNTTAPTTGGTTNDTSTTNTTGDTSTSGGTSSTDSSSSTDTGSSSSSEGTTSNDSSGSSEGGSDSSGGTETESQTEETKTEETKTEETKSEEKTEEVKEEKKEESTKETKEEEKKEESKEETEEEKKEEKEDKKDEEKKEEEEKEEKKKEPKMLPIQLKADAMAMQTPLGSYNAVMSFGASQSSIYGDNSYNLNMMLWDNLRQVSIMGGVTKINMKEDYSVKGINTYNIGYSNNFSISTLTLTYSKMKPFKNGLTVGVGITLGSTFESFPVEENVMVSYNVLATKSFKLTDRITYSPALIFTQTPVMTSKGGIRFGGNNPFGINVQNELQGTKIPFMGIMANSFTIQLTRRFSFNAGWTIIKSSDNIMPTMNSFMIGSKLPF